MKAIACFAILGALFGAACSASESGTASGVGGAGNSSGTSTNNGGASNGSGSNVGGAFGSGGSQSNGSGGACAGTTQSAQLIPLDMYIMLDSSGSMGDKTGMKGNGPTKWSAVTTAISGFLNDPQSAGLGVGLQYFPLIAAGAPTSCTSDAQCGAFGPCVTKTCTNNQNQLIPCSTNQDCGPGSQCITLGQCANNSTIFCLPIGGTCAGNAGACVPVYSSICLNEYSCYAADYATPAVEIAPLPGAASTLIGSMNSKTPEGNTPTSAALQGAIDHSMAWASSHATHKVVAVLATDGLPTQCSPTDIPGISQIAAAGVAGTPSILTFVIGVFSGGDTQAQSDLNQIAAAGGTNAAFMVDTNQDVTTAFITALNAIRGTSLACEYQIPPPPSGETLDYTQVNIEHTASGSTTPTTIYYVGSVDKCDPTTGGWYYDVDPASGGTPTKIEMCPATCTQFQQGGQVDIKLGCTTVVAPPK